LGIKTIFDVIIRLVFYGQHQVFSIFVIRVEEMLQQIKLQIITIIYTDVYLKSVDIWITTYQKLYIIF